jgi:hypothetical protein
MINARCACGFSEAGDETIDDHLIEAFAPDDGKEPDGRVHLEGEVNLFCLCGTGGSAAELDAHLLAVFPPADHVARDGAKHERAAMAASREDEAGTAMAPSRARGAGTTPSRVGGTGGSAGGRF